jgi:hypothetical protein
MKPARISRRLRGLALASLLGMLLPLPAGADVVVDTLGGGPTQSHQTAAGNADGSTFYESQFNGPMALAMDSTGTLYLADKNNGKVRTITVPGDAANSRTATFLSGLAQPVGVIVDHADFIYVLTQGDGKLARYDIYGNWRGTISSSLAGATAVTVDAGTNFYVSIAGPGTNGLVKKVTFGGVVTTVSNLFNQPQGIAILGNGLLAVSDTGNHAVRFIHPATGTNVLVIGGPVAGYANGPKEYARFNTPAGLAASPSGSLVVADRMNHRVRLVMTNGLTTTLYGIDPSQWGPTQPPTSYAGWFDGSAVLAEAREPISAVVSPAGALYTTELYYHLLRTASGAPLGVGGASGGGGTNSSSTNLVVIPPPVFDPLAGYFPMGQDIIVASAYPVYYTTDGTEPTTSSKQVALTNGNAGIISWDQPLRDLTSLRLKAINGTNASTTVGGVRVPVNELGVPRDVRTGSGSTALIPLVLNVRSNDVVRTLQYRVEITPQGNAPAILPGLDAVPISISNSSNDFVRVVGAAAPGTTLQYDRIAYDIAPTNLPGPVPGGLAVFVIGLDANFLVDHFGVVAMLKVPLDPLAQEGDTYVMTVSAISATSDGADTDVYVTPMPVRTLTVHNDYYTVGDSAGSRWYAAGDFGDGDLKNSDVNNAFYASLGIRTPPSYTDVFDAMDAWPPDSAGMVGGDMQIRQLDWETILMRSLRLDTNNYRRKWTTGGVRVSDTTVLHTQSKSATLAPGPGCVWNRQAKVYSKIITNAFQGTTYSLPVYVDVSPGCSLSGLSFRADVIAEDGGPVVASVTFVTASGKPSPSILGYPSSTEVCCGWAFVSSSKFVPALQGSSNLVGYVKFTVPYSAGAGQRYTLRFPGVDGLPNLTTQYDLEGVPGALWVRSAALAPPDIVSDQWKTAFFGAADDPRADSYADDDGDGMANWQEYLAGTNPTSRQSSLQVLNTYWTNVPARALVVNWLSAPGRKYTVERCDRINGTTWTKVASGVPGDGYPVSCLDTTASGRAQFYRLRLEP